MFKRLLFWTDLLFRLACPLIEFLQTQMMKTVVKSIVPVTWKKEWIGEQLVAD